MGPPITRQLHVACDQKIGRLSFYNWPGTLCLVLNGSGTEKACETISTDLDSCGKSVSGAIRGMIHLHNDESLAHDEDVLALSRAANTLYKSSQVIPML